jgi:hypothetical protein
MLLTYTLICEILGSNGSDGDVAHIYSYMRDFRFKRR